MKPEAAAWVDLRGVVALRMDDPGASASVHLRPWAYERLGERGWEQLGAILASQDARMTISYTPGWVDDGDAERGELLVDGRPVTRQPGAVHPSPLVEYRGRRAYSADCVAEYRGVERLRRAGHCSVELHGYTHMHPDLEAWLRADDRYEAVAWYRELAPETAATIAGRPASRHPVALGLELFRRHFAETPTALVCPGNAWTDPVLAVAERHGLELVAADGIALRGSQGFEWCWGIAATDFGAPSPAAFARELPVMACLHDRDVALHGVDWLAQGLSGWRSAGAAMFTDLRELTAALGLSLELEAGKGGWRVHARRARGPRLTRAFPIGLRAPQELPRRLELLSGEDASVLEVEPLPGGHGRAELPAGI